MTRIPLVGGAYQSQALIASAQRCVNLFPESNPKDSQSPVPVTHFPTPGLTALSSCPAPNRGRGLYQSSNGQLYGCVGPNVYYIDPGFTWTLLGQVSAGNQPVSMSDNSAVVAIADGTSTGYAIDMAGSGTSAFGKVTDTNYLGSPFVDQCDGYFLYNCIKTPTQSPTKWFISLNNVSFLNMTGPQTTSASGAQGAFNPLDIVSKNGSPDPVARIMTVHREPWIIGQLTSEVWYDSGATDFPFAPLPGAFVEHGCVAPYSVAQQDLSLFWLAGDRQGQLIIVKATGYGVSRVSTHAIEKAMRGYKITNDAIGYAYTQKGHAFYVITFPSADRTWVYELQTQQWHEWASFDQNGIQHRHPVAFHASAYGINVGMDLATGQLYSIDPTNFTDNGSPIVRIRTFPHQLEDGKMVTYNSCQVDLQTGTDGSQFGQYSGATPSWAQRRIAPQGRPTDPNSAALLNAPKMSLRVSFNRGVSYGNAYIQTFGGTGEYADSVEFPSLGSGRDCVLELSWSTPTDTALQGAFIDTEPCEE